MTEDHPAGDRRTALHALHLELGARMVPFAGYDMPVQYPAGILAEHHHTRKSASLFDVGHMGQAILRGDNPAELLETLVPGDIVSLDVDRTRYTQLTGPSGGILDDLMVTRRADHLFLVVNASRKEIDFAHIQSALGGACELEPLEDRALIALQGPSAAAVLGGLAPAAVDMPFMSIAELTVDGIPVWVSRSGYTGEDGYELSVENTEAENLAQILLGDERVTAAGLGARDTLRLEAGLCLYGHDIDERTTPVEAGLLWSIGKRRREEGGFLGAETVLRQIADGPSRRRVGIKPDGKAPARDGTPIEVGEGDVIGEITSGGFGPTMDAPVAMGYVGTKHAAPDTAVSLSVRGRSHPARVVKLPFVAHRYFRS